MFAQISGGIFCEKMGHREGPSTNVSLWFLGVSYPLANSFMTTNPYGNIICDDELFKQTIP
jgi:hypothetical protein